MKDETIRPVAEVIYQVRTDRGLPPEPDTDWYMAIEYVKYWNFMDAKQFSNLMFDNKLSRKVSPIAGGY